MLTLCFSLLSKALFSLNLYLFYLAVHNASKFEPMIIHKFDCQKSYKFVKNAFQSKKIQKFEKSKKMNLQKSKN